MNPLLRKCFLWCISFGAFAGIFAAFAQYHVRENVCGDKTLPPNEIDLFAELCNETVLSLFANSVIRGMLFGVLLSVVLYFVIRRVRSLQKASRKLENA